MSFFTYQSFAQPRVVQVSDWCIMADHLSKDHEALHMQQPGVRFAHSSLQIEDV